MRQFNIGKVTFGSLIIKGKVIVSKFSIANYLLLAIKEGPEVKVNIGDQDPQEIINYLKGEK